MRRLVSVLCALTAIAATACEGKVLDVGQGHSAQEAGDPSSIDAANGGTISTSTTDLEGIWVLTRQEGVVGVESSEAVPPIELEIAPGGKATRYRCVRTTSDTATTQCPATATIECSDGTMSSEGTSWRLRVPDINPAGGQATLLSDGTLYITYLNGTFSGGYLKRIAESGAVAAGCAQ